MDNWGNIRNFAYVDVVGNKEEKNHEIFIIHNISSYFYKL